MRIIDLSVFRRNFRLSNPSIVAYETIDVAPNVIVRIQCANGLVGWGNAAPDEHVTGETAASVEQTIREIFQPALLGAEAMRIEALWARLHELAPHQPAAIAAVDIALYDLLGQAAGLPLYRLLGAARSEIVTSVTLSIEEMAVSVARAREFQRRGFRALKIKCGLDVAVDIARAQAIRAAVGSELRLSLDANQGYDVEQTLHALAALWDCDIAFIEQPVAASDLESLREVCRRAPIPVMADEAVLDARDVLTTPAPLVNLKLMKTGGITGALKANAVAETRGIRVMIGCMDESVISLAAATHLALALNNTAYADLDGHLDIVNDVASGGIILQSGALSVSERAGLGVTVNTRIA